MIITDNGTGALAQVYNRAEQTRLWRLALWHARANARRLHMQGAQGDLARLLQIIAGAQEGTPPARLEPSAQAHESRGLHCIVMHPSKVGMQKGAPAIRRGSLDPRDCADTFRGQGLPQTRADYRADYAVSAHLRDSDLTAYDIWQRARSLQNYTKLHQEQEQAESWTAAAERAERALFVWQRFILRLPAGKAEQEQEQAEQEQGKARKPAILAYLRGLRPLRKAQARALRAVLQAGGHGPTSLEQEEARRYCAPCACPACAEHSARVTARILRLRDQAEEQEQAKVLPALPVLHDPAPYLDWRLRAKRLARLAHLRALRHNAQTFAPLGLQTTGETYGPPLRLADPRAVCSAARARLQ